MNVRNKFWDPAPYFPRIDWATRRRLQAPRPCDLNCPWCANPPSRPWGTQATSKRNIKRAVRKGQMRIAPQSRYTRTTHSRTTAICNHPCHTRPKDD